MWRNEFTKDCDELVKTSPASFGDHGNSPANPCRIGLGECAPDFVREASAKLMIDSAKNHYADPV